MLSEIVVNFLKSTNLYSVEFDGKLWYFYKLDEIYPTLTALTLDSLNEKIELWIKYNAH